MTDQQRPPPIPTWVKVIGIGLVAILLLAVIVLLVTGGTHGPGLHGPADGEWIGVG